METTAARFSAKDMAYIAVFTALLAVCSWIAIPMPWGVAYTLQTLGVFLAVGVLGGKRGTLAVVVYLLLGAMGVPVFSGFQDRRPAGDHRGVHRRVPLLRPGHVDAGEAPGAEPPRPGPVHGPGAGGVLCLRHRLVHGGLHPV